MSIVPNNSDNFSSDDVYTRRRLFCIEVITRECTRWYSYGSRNWYREDKYFDGTNKVKQRTYVSCSDIGGYFATQNSMIIWNKKVTTKFYSNGRTKSIETICCDCQNQNNCKCNYFCGKQYYYHENGHKDKILNYLFFREYSCNSFNKISPQGQHGIQYNYNKNGKISKQEYYAFGTKHGWQNLYSERGHLKESQLYHNGVLSRIEKV